MTRLAPNTAILAQLARLRAGLNEAAKRFDPEAEDRGRVGVLFALNEIDDALRSILGIRDQSIFVPLSQLAYALHDLGQGKVAPLLSPNKVKNRPKDLTSKEAFRALAAVAMELFIKGKVPRKQAARDVAKALSNMGYESSAGKQIPAKLVENWRNRVRVEDRKKYPPAARFHRMVPQLMAMFPNNPIAAAKYLLGRIPTTLPPDIPTKPHS